jgi:hypothetical protein
MVEPVFARIKNNLRAGRFYERRGWISDGHRTSYPELGVADTRFRLSLSEGAVDRQQPERGEPHMGPTGSTPGRTHGALS